jgi:hypothetical protein
MMIAALFGSKGEQETPYAVCCVKSQFLHLGVTGTFQSIDMGPAQLQAESL